MKAKYYIKEQAQKKKHDEGSWVLAHITSKVAPKSSASPNVTNYAEETLTAKHKTIHC